MFFPPHENHVPSVSEFIAPSFYITPDISEKIYSGKIILFSACQPLFLFKTGQKKALSFYLSAQHRPPANRRPSYPFPILHHKIHSPILVIRIGIIISRAPPVYGNRIHICGGGASVRHKQTQHASVCRVGLPLIFRIACHSGIIGINICRECAPVMGKGIAVHSPPAKPIAVPMAYGCFVQMMIRL